MKTGSFVRLHGFPRNVCLTTPQLNTSLSVGARETSLAVSRARCGDSAIGTHALRSTCQLPDFQEPKPAKSPEERRRERLQKVEAGAWPMRAISLQRTAAAPGSFSAVRGIAQGDRAQLQPESIQQRTCKQSQTTTLTEGVAGCFPPMLPCGTAWALRPGRPDAKGPAQRASCGGALANTWTRPLFAAAFCTLVGKEAGEGQGNAGKHETQVLRLPKIMDVEDVSKLLAQFVGHSFLTALQTLRAGKSRGLEAFWHRCCARFAEKVPRLLANWCLLGGAGLASCLVSTR